MTSEDSMRDRIAAELDGRRPPLGDLVGQAVAEGRRQNRRAQIGVTVLSAVGVLAVVGAAMQFEPTTSATAQSSGTMTGSSSGLPSTGTTSSPSPSAATTTPTEATTPLPVSAIVKYVDPGTVTLDKGIYLNYTATSMSWWEYQGGLTVQYSGSNTWGSDFVSLGKSDRLVTGFYVGDKDVAAAAVTIDGKQYAATVVKVSGAQGWCGLYVLRPPGQPAGESFQIDVYDSNGQVIATTQAGLVKGPHLTPGGVLHSFATPGTVEKPSPGNTASTRTLPVINTPIDTPFPGATSMVPSGGNG